MANFHYHLRNLRARSSELTSEASQLLDDTVAYIASASYTERHRASEFMTNHLNGLSDTEIASVMGLSKNTVRIARQQMFRELEGILGDDFLSLVEDDTQYSLQTAKARLQSASQLSRDPIIERFDPYFVARLRAHSTPPPPNFDIRSCPDEVAALLSYSMHSIESKLASLDPEALGYLLLLIEGKGGSPSDRMGIVNVLDRNSR